MSTTNEIPLTDREKSAERLILLLKALSDADKVLQRVEKSEGAAWQPARGHLLSKRRLVYKKIVTFVADCLRDLFEHKGHEFPAARSVARGLVKKSWPNGPDVLPPSHDALADWLRTFASGSRLLDLTPGTDD